MSTKCYFCFKKQRLNQLMVITSFIGLLLLIPSCSHSDSEESNNTETVIDYNELVTSLNENIRSVQKLVEMKVNNKELFSLDSNADNPQLLFLNEEKPVTLKKINTAVNVLYPCLSIVSGDDDYYWTFSNGFLTNSNGDKICVSEKDVTPTIHYQNDKWTCTVGDTTYTIEKSKLSYGYPVIEKVDGMNAYISFPSHFQLSFPLSHFHVPEVPNRSFYKDIFLDAGIGLTSRKSLSAANLLKLSLEGISFSRYKPFPEEYEQQNEIIGGNSEDTNGRLLYPDGQPRYKVLFVNGGSSKTHGESLDEISLENLRDFVRNGGSYVGTCAGAFFVSNGYDNNIDYSYYLSLWPSQVKHTGLSNSSSGMFIEPGSPLLQYYDFGGDLYIEDIRHNKGGYPVFLPQGTEVLARYDYPSKSDVHMQPSAWSYKENSHQGRIVMEGSHPEEVADGERRDFTASMILYAIDGLGNTSLKGFLQNGRPRQMDKSTEDKVPSFTKIGDKQYHHFVVYIPDKANNIRVSVNSSIDCDLALRMAKNTFAYAGDTKYASSKGGPNQMLSVGTLEEGLWYISVQCLTTPTVEQTNYGQNYRGRMDVLNGIPYSIVVSWD